MKMADTMNHSDIPRPKTHPMNSSANYQNPKAIDTLNLSPDMQNYLMSKGLSQEEINWYGTVLPEKMVDLYQDESKRPYIEYFIDQELQDAKDNEGEWTNQGGMRTFFLNKQTNKIWEQLAKDEISLENFKIYVQLLFALKEQHVNNYKTSWHPNTCFYNNFCIPTGNPGNRFFASFKEGQLEKLLTLPQEIKSNFLDQFQVLRSKYERLEPKGNFSWAEYIRLIEKFITVEKVLQYIKKLNTFSLEQLRTELELWYETTQAIMELLEKTGIITSSDTSWIYQVI